MTAAHLPFRTVGDWANLVFLVVELGGLVIGAWHVWRKVWPVLKSIDSSVNNKEPGESTLRQLVIEQGGEVKRLASAVEVVQADLAANTRATVRVDRKIDEHIAFHKGKESAGGSS